MDIVTPKKIVYSADAVSLIVPAQLGYLGVLAGHTPLIARLKKGKIILRDSSAKTVTFYCEGRGFMEVLKNRATLILDSAVDST